jgi:hypothetical protein
MKLFSSEDGLVSDGTKEPRIQLYPNKTWSIRGLEPIVLFGEPLESRSGYCLLIECEEASEGLTALENIICLNKINLGGGYNLGDSEFPIITPLQTIAILHIIAIKYGIVLPSMLFRREQIDD